MTDPRQGPFLSGVRERAVRLHVLCVLRSGPSLNPCSLAVVVEGRPQAYGLKS